jgi:hypothetical protein
LSAVRNMLFLVTFAEIVKVKEMKYSVLLTICGLSIFMVLLACGGEAQINTLGKTPDQPFPTQRNDSPGVIPAYNEAPLDSSLNLYLTKLIEAVDKKDADYLLSVIDDSTHFTFGAERGKAEFAKLWKLDSDPAASPVWATLKDVLSLSGGFYGQGRDLFVAPYYFTLWPQEYIPARHNVVIAEGVALLDTSDVNAAVVDTLDYEIVRMKGGKTEPVSIGGDSYPWYKVETLQNKAGWVYGKFLRSPTGYRIGFYRANGNWRVVFFVTEDGQNDTR